MWAMLKIKRLAVLGGSVALLAGCGGQSIINPAMAAKYITQGILNKTGYRPVDVACPSGVPAGTSESARSSSVRRCAKLSEMGPGVARSQPNTLPTKERKHRSARTAGSGRKEVPGASEKLGERDSATCARQIHGPRVV